MAFEVVVPQMGESVLEGTIVQWMVKAGDRVTLNQPLVEIMTDKVNVEIPAEYAGVIEAILVQPDEVVPVGKVICTIAVSGEMADEPAAVSAPKETVSQKAAPAATKSEAPVASAPTKSTGKAGKVKMAPAVRKLVRDYGLDVGTIIGTGPSGRITREDVEKAASARSVVGDITQATTAPSSTPAPAPSATPAPAVQPTLSKYVPPTTAGGEMVEERIPLAGARKMIAEHMVRSVQTSTHVTTFEECDFTNLVEFRSKMKDNFLASYGAKLTYLPFIMKAAVEGLKEFPALNASMTDTEIIYKKYYNIGVAVARESGLIVPVIRDADKKSVIDIAVELTDLGNRARTDKLTINEVQGGTFTLTNAGMFGAGASTPIISQPQVAILGIHNIAKKPAVINDEIVIRHLSTFCLSFDHRLIDGHTAVQFLHRVIEYLQEPSLLLTRLR